MPPLKKYFVQEDEFRILSHPIYNNLKIHDQLGEKERTVAFLKELAHSLQLPNLVMDHYTHGGYIPLECASSYTQINVSSSDPEHESHLRANMEEYAVANITISSKCSDILVPHVLLCERLLPLKIAQAVIIISENSISNNDYQTFTWENTKYLVHVHTDWQEAFSRAFSYEIQGSTLTYDNLLHFTMIVKNGGDQLEEMLIQNAPFFDRWTIVDTGSTDRTVEIIERVLKNKRGCLYKETFRNFGETRNLCLDYAEKQHSVPCEYMVMLDDTYVLQGDLRSFLREIRGDRFANSFSLFISSHDCKYVSNRIIKTGSKLRYKYRIHEVLEEQGNINVVVPIDKACVLDKRFDYMEARTMARKRQDIQWLEEEIEENSSDPRNYYYMAQTYMLLGEYEKAYTFFSKRADFAYSGFIQERIDAVFEMGRIANFQLKKPWSECQALYEMAHVMDPTRPESLYFIGIHYFQENQMDMAYKYFKQAFGLGYPEHCQHSLKPTLYFHFVPKFLARSCFFLRDYTLGKKAVEYFMQHNTVTSENYHEMQSWYNIFHQCVLNETAKPLSTQSNVYEKPICMMVVDGGFDPWTGSDILTKGMGGSETCMIELAQNIEKQGDFQVVVFCQCSDEMTFWGVEYRHLRDLYSFVQNYNIHTCIVSRYTEYLAPLSNQNIRIENLYLILHDLMLPETVMIKDHLKAVFCLTEWHANHIRDQFPSLESLIQVFSYGIDFNQFDGAQSQKIPHSFIYSSYPERGLLPLLQMWPRIVYEFPTATLDIFANVDNTWSNQYYPKQMTEIREILARKIPGIQYHGRVNKSILAKHWKSAEYWLYPCTFQETFCLTALEAAASKTIVLTNGLAALQNSASADRSIVMQGDPSTSEWKAAALQTVLSVMKHRSQGICEAQIQANYKWAKNLTWENRAKEMNQLFQKQKLEYRGTKDVLPLNVLPPVLKAPLQHVLQVGVWSGISLISMVQQIQKRYSQVLVVAMDAWENYMEKGKLQEVETWGIEASFDKNMATAGISSCIEKRKGKLRHLLLQSLQDKEQYDFIWMERSRDSWDQFANGLLTWPLLKKGGMLWMDKKQGTAESLIEMLSGEMQIIQNDQWIILEKK